MSLTLTQCKDAIKEIGKDELKELIEEHGEDKIKSAIACGVQLEDIEECFAGEWTNDVEFVQNLLEETDTVPENLPGYVHIDWEGTARDVMMDYSEDGGYYWRNI